MPNGGQSLEHLVYYILLLYRLKSAKITDKRLRVMNEIINGIKLIKMYTWEWAFSEYVNKIRKLALYLHGLT